MANKQLELLIVEDVPDDAELLVHQIQRNGGYEVRWRRVDTAQAMHAALDEKRWDLIVSDFSMPSFSATAALSVVQQRGDDVPFIIMSGTAGEEAAVAALQAGAQDFLIKGRSARLVPAIERVMRETEVRRRQREVEATLRETEEQLRQAQKLEAIGRLAGGIAHDFNNLLAVVLSYSHLLLEDVKPGDPGHDEIKEIRRAGERARDLTRQLLAFSRRQLLEPRIVDVNQILQEVAKMLTRVLGEDVELVTSLAPGLDPILADPGQLEQVVMNLVVNARDAMPDGGKLTIATANVSLGSGPSREHLDAPPGACVMLSVSDTGMGMDKATQTQVFEPFFTTKEPGKGTGLGLSTVFGIVKQSGGSISLLSEPGAGATFRIYFPRANVEASSQRRLPTLGSDLRGGSETILLVEDESQLRRVTGTILRRAGYEVLEAANPAQALAVFGERRASIQLLLSDMVMPRMGGWELAHRIRELGPDVRVLFMSGYTDDAILRRDVTDSRIAFMQKPFTPESITRRVREVLDAAPP